MYGTVAQNEKGVRLAQDEEAVSMHGADVRGSIVAQSEKGVRLAQDDASLYCAMTVLRCNCPALT
jgi:hypothetical protein